MYDNSIIHDIADMRTSQKNEKKYNCIIHIYLYKVVFKKLMLEWHFNLFSLYFNCVIFFFLLF